MSEISSSHMSGEPCEHKKSRKERKQGRINNTLHLWEFLLELLEDERYTPLISWTRKEEGEFKIKRQEDVAKKWGRLKQRTSMNYDKLSRALRYYYHKGIIKKVQGQRLVYKFDKLPYAYNPVRYNWPWKLPSEELDVKPIKPDTVTPPVPKATHRSVMPTWEVSNSEQDVKPIRHDTVPPLVSIASHRSVMTAWKISNSEQDVKPVRPDTVPPLVSKATHRPVMTAWKVSNSGQHVKPARTDTVPPLVSKTTHWSRMSARRGPNSDEDVKPVKPNTVPPLIHMSRHSPVVPALDCGKRSPVLPESVPRNQQTEFSSVGCHSQRPSQAICRSQIIFPPCSCMRSAVCGVRRIPISDVTSVPVKVITRFV